MEIKPKKDNKPFVKVTPEIVLTTVEVPVLTEPVLLVDSEPAETKALAVRIDTPVT